MNSEFTLTRFLEDTGATLRFYDVGRRIAAIPRDDFLAFEQTRLPYPHPLQGKAWFAVVQTREIGAEPVIWFLRLDLDEQGKLLQATRDYLIHRFVEIASTAGDDAATADPGAALQDNPYVFKPRDDRMAVLHARVTLDLGLPPSRFHAHAMAYFRGEPGWDQWSFLGYQGIADVALRATVPEVETLLVGAVGQAPVESLTALLHCLENVEVGEDLGAAIVQRVRTAMTGEDGHESPLVAAGIRALSQAAVSAQRRDLVSAALAVPTQVGLETLAALGGRSWEVLRDPAIATAYLAALVETPNHQEVFRLCLTDVLAVPGMREPLMSALKAPETPSRVREAFAEMRGPQT